MSAMQMTETGRRIKAKYEAMGQQIKVEPFGECIIARLFDRGVIIERGVKSTADAALIDLDARMEVY